MTAVAVHDTPDHPDYLPIAEHGVIGDQLSVALVGTDGTIDWYCPERFDAPSVFASILDRARGGYCRIASISAPTRRPGPPPSCCTLLGYRPV